MKKNEEYLSRLAANLQMRGLPDERINEIISESENHLDDSGEDPQTTFGSAEIYAEAMAVQIDNQSDNKGENHSKSEPASDFHHRTFRATAFDEMEILEKAGLDGWELIDVGGLALFCQRPVDPNKRTRWEYNRRTSCHRLLILESMKKKNWQPCGRWLPFHYFKRKLV